MPLSPMVENGITGAEALVAGAGGAIRTWANANMANLPTAASLTMTGANASAIRGVLLGYLAFGKRDNAIVPRFQPLISNWQQSDLQAELKAYYAFSKAPAMGVILMPSFRHATTVNRENAKKTLGDASTVMMKAYLSATKGKSGAGEERTKMEEWFGAHDATRFSTVVANLKKLTDVLGTTPIRLYYRGTNIKGPSDKPNEDGAAPTSQAFASAFKLSKLPASYDRKFSHVTLGEKFFNFRAQSPGVGGQIANQVAMFGGAAARLTRPNTTFATTTGTNSIGGVLVHELSHHVCDTEDIALPAGSPNAGNKCYGQGNCRWLAANVPGDAIKNADTYEYYFEMFQ